MEDTLLNAAIQLPVVALFIFFILKFWDRISKLIDETNDRFLQALADERKHRIEMMDKERESRKELAERLAEIMEKANESLAQLHVKMDRVIETMATHDARAAQYINTASSSKPASGDEGVKKW